MYLAERSWMTEEHEVLRDTVEKFIVAQITPYYEEWEAAGIVPREVWDKLGSCGLLSPDIPERYGGAGGSFTHLAVILNEFARHGYAVFAGSMLGVHSGIANHYILNHGSKEQKQRYLPSMASGETVTAIAMTEPAAGSDLQGVQTVAEREGNGYIINGAKTFISNGQNCDTVIVVAKTDRSVAGSRGISLLMVDANSDGFTRGRNLEKIGLHCADTSELFFDNVRVEGDALLGTEHGGFSVLMNELPRERLTLAIGSLGAIEGALNWTVEYIRERQAFGQALSSFQNTRFKVAEMMTEARALRSFIDDCIASLSVGALDSATASMAKLKSTEAQGEIVDSCLQLFGGYGYMREFPISRAFVDARVQRIYGGTSEIMKEIIARDLLGR